MKTLFCFGLGYSAKVFAHFLQEQGWRVIGTTRSEEGCSKLRALGIDARLYQGDGPNDLCVEGLAEATHLLMSIAPGDNGDPVLRDFGEILASSKNIEWCGYLSTVGVYGDHQGQWIDEGTEPKPVSVRSKRRVVAENGWLEMWNTQMLPVHVFRLAGIYGPGRSAIDNLQQGRARRIVKAGQVFNRIHVEDISKVLFSSVQNPKPGSIYNVTDNEPAPPQDVVTYAAEVLYVPPPPFVSFEDADLSPMGRSFYGENKRVSNKRIRDELGVTLSYPTYREGMAALARLVR